MCRWLYLARGSCGFSPWYMSSVSEKILCDLPLLQRRPMLDLVSLESPDLGFTTLQSWGENICSFWWNVFTRECILYVRVRECFSANVCFQITTLAGLPGTGESPICPDRDSLLLTHPQSARGNDSMPPPPSLLLTAPTAYHCPNISSF